MCGPSRRRASTCTSSSGRTQIKLNFLEAIGQGSSPTPSPRVAITSPVARDQASSPVRTSPSRPRPTSASLTKVEFFVDGESIGIDQSAPYAAQWAAPAEGLHELTAVATSANGKSTTSRIVLAQVGESLGGLVPFSNAGGVVERIGDGRFRITGAGANTWQGVDQYSTLYAPAGGDQSWEAIVKVDAQQNTNASAKAGVIVRNNLTQPGTSPGYAMVGIRPTGGVEFLSDTDGNGQLNASVAGGTTSYPTWVKLKRAGSSYTAYFSKNGTTWTQVGGVVNLTGAAAQQDVGLFTVSHSTAAGTVDFADFAITDPPAAVAGIIKGAQSSRCVDVPGGNHTSGVRPALWDCNGGANQRWTADGTQLKDSAGLCLTVAGNGTADGAAVQISTCNGATGQQWTVNSSGTIVNPPSGKCLDATAQGTVNGTLLAIWTCNGGANQRWSRS